MSWKLQLRTNSGCTALLVLSGDQTVVEVTNVYSGLVSSRRRVGPYAGWLPIGWRDAVVAAGAQNVGA